jgi:putative DNA methylase
LNTNKKLIEVALPLEAINIASAREKSIRHGHPSTLHLWWARRPLAAARAVIFSQMVDDPSSYLEELRGDAKLLRKAQGLLEKRKPIWEKARAEHARATQAGMTAPGPGPEPMLDDILAELERNRLFRIIEDLVLWENTTNEKVLDKARAEIWQSWRRTCARNADHPRAAELFDRNKLPAFHDPFAGGGALPLEAQRLGLEAYASDLNPVAVLINKAMIEIPPKFAGRPPVHPVDDAKLDLPREWKGAQGLAEDVRYYGKWMRDEAEKRIGHLYPKIEVTAEMAKERPDLKPYVGKQLTVIAWLWARTVKSPNPAFAHVDVPLASTFMLSTKEGKEAYVQPVIEGDTYQFTVKVGKPKNAEAAKNGTKLARGAHFKCLLSHSPIASGHIYSEGKAGRMGARLMAIVAEGERGRVYLPPNQEHVSVAQSATPDWKPELAMPENPRWFSPPGYGLTTYGDLFTPRQLVALTTFSDLVGEARERMKHDALAAGLSDDGRGLEDGGTGAQAYADAVGVCLGLCVSRQANRTATLNFWDTKGENVQQVFARQALPMTWDFVEGNPLSASTGNFIGQVHYLTLVVEGTLPASHRGTVTQSDAQSQTITAGKVVSTDPPYYDNIGYAELSDFFYVWLRRSVRQILPELFATVAVPKVDELVATPYRHGGKHEAEEFFLDGMTMAMCRLAQQASTAYPVTLYYAFKQSENDGKLGTASTGWETFLEAVIQAGFAISGTWPIRTELIGNLKKNVAALASSIVLVCHPRPSEATNASRRELVSALKRELPRALRLLQVSNIAPVDLAQAAIGPGIGVYSRYAKVIDAQGKPIAVRDALALINQILDETLAQQEGDFDGDTRWALTWFEQYWFDEGEYGVAETLSKAKNTSVSGMVEAGIVTSSRGKVRLLKPADLPDDWEPQSDSRLTAWEILHHLIRVLEAGSEVAAAELVRTLGGQAEVARELAYRLYTVCERKKRAAEALSYNGLVQSWPEITRLAQESRSDDAAQERLL